MIKILNVKSLHSALYKAVDFCKENDKEIIEIIVPDKLSLFMEKFLFEHLNIVASFNIKVSTLNRFAKKSCFVEKDKQISKVGSILLIHKILNENFNKLEVLKNKAYSFSYAEDIFRTIGQLKASKINFEEMKNFSSNDARLTGKIKDLALVYEQYEIGKAGFLDASDMFLMSTMSVAKGKENSKLLFVGFDDFTAIEYAIIEQLAKVAEVNVLNYYSNGSNKFLYNNEIISQLKNIAYLNQLPFEICDFECKTNKLIQFLENNLYALTKNNYLLTDNIIQVYSGNNIKDEIEFVARNIRHKVLNNKQFKQFGVAVFNLENNINKIKEIFDKYEINYYLDTEISLNKSVLYKFFINVLKYNLEGYGLDNLIDLINSPFFELDNTEKRTIIQKLLAIKFHGKITQQMNIDIDEEVKQKFIDFIKLITFDKNAQVDDLIFKFKEIGEVLNIEQTMQEIADGDVFNSVLMNKSQDVILSLFEDILKFNPNIDIESFLDILIHCASIVKINNLPLSLDAVKVVDANNTMEIFEEFYIVGLTHENAPNLKYDCGIILDSEIEKLNFANKLSPTIAHINKLSKLRLFNLMMCFERELTLTYSNSSSEVVKEMCDKIQVETDKDVMNIVPISRFDFEKHIALSKWDYIEYLSRFNKSNEKFNEKLIKNKNFSQISQENLNIFDDLKTISATALENYFKCPFYAFLTNVVKIKPRVETEILSLDIGNVLHEIMFKYYKLNKKVDDIYDFCKTEVFKCVDKVERLKLNVDSPILVNLIDEAVRVVNAVNYIDDNSDFVPKFFEYDFKDDKALQLKNISIIGKVDRIDLCDDMFRIVDYKSGRADASLKELYYGNKLQLFLYSCAMERVLKKRAVGSFYLPLHNAYTRELSNTYSLKGFYLAEDFVVRAFDRRLEAGKKSDIVNVKLTKKDEIAKQGGFKELDVNELNRLKNYSKLVSENAVKEMRSGYIAPTPSDVSKPCEYCPYIHVCLKKSNDIEYRKSNKVNLSSFEEVQDERI